MDSHDDALRPDELLAQLGWVRALARRLVANPEVTDDVLQQVCLLALQQPRDDVRTGPRLRAWLATVTRNLALHATRSDDRRRRREQAAARPEALPATVDVAAHREALRRLVEAVTSLEEPSYSVIIARYFDGRSVAEIAVASGASHAAVRQRLSRARRQLRVRLESLFSDDRPGRLSLALPFAPLAASVKSASAKSLLFRLGGSLVAKSTPVLVSAICVGLVLTGGLLFLRDGEDAVVPQRVAHHVRPMLPVTTPSVVPALPVPERPEPACLEPAPKFATAPAPEPAADRLTLPAVPAGRAWDGLFQAADDLAFGTITQEGVVKLAFDLLAQLPADATPQLSYGYATYDLLDTPGTGKVQLIVNLEPPKDGVGDPIRMSTFTIQAMLDTRPGAYTGNAADNSTSTKLDICISTDEHETLTSVNALSQNVMPGSKDLWSQMNGSGRPVAIGGVFNVAGEAASWRPITVEASGTAEAVGFLHKIGEPIARDGKLADPRTQLLNDVLADKRKSVPH